MFDSLASRRVFIQRGMALLAAAGTVPTFLDNTVMALTKANDVPNTQLPSGKDGKILVVVQLSGGNDGLNTIIPYADDAYYRLRPNIAHEAKTVLKLDDHIGLHPNLAPLQPLLDKNMFSVIQGVGYPNPNRSHFRAMDIWQSAHPEADLTTSGWLGRYFDNTCNGTDPHVGVAIGDQLPMAMRGERVLPLSFDKPENYRYNGNDKTRYMKLNTHDDSALLSTPLPLAKPKAEVVTPDSQLAFLTRTAMDAQVSSDDILRMTADHNAAKGSYPNGTFGEGLRTVAAMIRGGLPTRVYYVTLGGFDTHAGERGRHDQLMQQFAAGVSAFWKDMADQKNEQRVMMMTFSEFGRRVASNASGGTDHGAAAPMMLMGAGCKQAVVGNHPSLTDLDAGDLKYAIDFRSVYASLLQNWLDTPSKPILGAQFPTMPIVRA